ncbi:Nif11-like leader peptide family RiPP precursor [Thiorhodovibrio frisius]|uniref:Bacteriocin propeptide, TIGR03798 family n=1 Tax=Thiorhodovibrio frisius TaxID=631362 RepID=H8Z1N7_9GAMM|nr:Nif11-like leader peptide family RiPP precursor [Thiorhodovibrio frisius]EIC21482.1 bacteriocin propeptide, TIGR03798 family [Thiorhodovibrio frisius]WPL24068.1 nif11-like leader peptide domain protein [Thiorhodovibrio frisius]
MSTQDLQTLMKMVEDDSAVAEKVEAIGHDNIDGLIAYARELGLSLDESDFTAMKESLLRQGQEISEEELESVAGGWLFRPYRRRHSDYRF